MSSLKDTDEVASLADAFERSANWLDNGALDGPARTHPLVGAADYRRASEALRDLQRERDELAQQRGDLLQRVVALQTLVRQVLADAEAQEVLFEWYGEMRNAVASESQPSEQTK